MSLPFFFCESMAAGMPGPLVVLPFGSHQDAGLSIHHCFSIISANVNSVRKAKKHPNIIIEITFDKADPLKVSLGPLEVWG